METTRSEIDEINKELDYAYFLNDFFSFQLSLLKSLKDEPDEISLRYQLEKSVVHSLSTIWTMHVLLSTLDSLHQKITEQKFLTDSHPDRPLGNHLLLLKEMQGLIEQHSFVQELDRSICLKFIKQIIPYYRDDSAPPVVKANEQGKPWYSIAQVSQWEKNDRR